MTDADRAAKDATILMLAERLYICSRLLTCAAERLRWDDATVRDLMQRLNEQVKTEIDNAGL